MNRGTGRQRDRRTEGQGDRRTVGQKDGETGRWRGQEIYDNKRKTK